MLIIIHVGKYQYVRKTKNSLVWFRTNFRHFVKSLNRIKGIVQETARTTNYLSLPTTANGPAFLIKLLVPQ